MMAGDHHHTLKLPLGADLKKPRRSGCKRGKATERKARIAGRGPGFSALCIVRTLGCADTDSNALATL